MRSLIRVSRRGFFKDLGVNEFSEKEIHAHMKKGVYTHPAVNDPIFKGPAHFD